MKKYINTSSVLTAVAVTFGLFAYNKFAAPYTAKFIDGGSK